MSGSAKIIGLAVLLALVSGAARADWRVDAETGALYDSNLSNSERASDVKDDWAWQSNLRVGNGFQLARDLRLNLGVDLREQVWARFDAFNNVAPGGTASLRYRFGLGRLAPWVLIEDRLAYAFFKEGDRSGLDNRFRIRGGFGITERLSLEAAYTFDDYEAQKSFLGPERKQRRDSPDVRCNFVAAGGVGIPLPQWRSDFLCDPASTRPCRALFGPRASEQFRESALHRLPVTWRDERAFCVGGLHRRQSTFLFR